MTVAAVLDRIRIPPWLRAWAEQAWRETPPIARAFLGLAAVDVLGRSFGLLTPHLSESLGNPLALFASFVPHDVWILLPAVLVLRRPDAPRVTPWLVRGAVVLAVAEFATIPLRSLFGSTGSLEGRLVSEWLAFGSLAAVTVGRVMVGRGLGRLNPSTPTPFIDGLANLVVIGIVLQGLTGLFQMASSTVSLGDDGLDALVAWNGLASTAALFAWGYILRSVVRAVDDQQRDVWAVTTAASGAVLASIAGLLAAIASVVTVALGAGPGVQTTLSVISWTAYVFAPALVLAAFFLGLAEPPFPMAAPEPDAARPAPDAARPAPDAAPEADAARPAPEVEPPPSDPA